MMGEDDSVLSDSVLSDYYGVEVTKDTSVATLTGKYYLADDYSNDKVTNLALEADADLTDMVSANFEYVANSTDQADTSDSLMRLGGTATLNDALSVNASYLDVGKDFVGAKDDLDATDYNNYKVGADYVLDANNTVTGSYETEDYAAANSDVNTITLGLNNVRGDLTTDVTFENEVTDDASDTTVNALTVNSTYALTADTTLNGKFVNQSGDADTFNYVKGEVKHKLAENVDWNTKAQLITGEDESGNDVEGNRLKTELVVSF
jgi:hypothetical protein